MMTKKLARLSTADGHDRGRAIQCMASKVEPRAKSRLIMEMIVATEMISHGRM